MVSFQRKACKSANPFGLCNFVTGIGQEKLGQESVQEERCLSNSHLPTSPTQRCSSLDSPVDEGRHAFTLSLVSNNYLLSFFSIS